MTKIRRLSDPEATKPARVDIYYKGSCDRCGGTGIYHIWGECFRCGGSGVDPTPAREWAFPQSWTVEQVEAWEAKRQERNRKATERRQAKRQAEIEAAQAEAQVSNAEVLEAADRAELVQLEASFLIDIYDQASHRPLTPTQIKTFKRVLAEARERYQAEQDRLATRQPVPTGTVEVVGTIKSVKSQPDYTGWGTTLKMLVESPEGWAVWGTFPSSLDATRGDLVRFTADVEASPDDEFFGFFKRPRKAELVEAGE